MKSSKGRLNDTELYKKVGLAIRLARTARGLNQTELGQAIGGKSQNFIHKLEAGLTEPGVVTLLRIADALNTSVNAFLAPIVELSPSGNDVRDEVLKRSQDLIVSILKTFDSKQSGAKKRPANS